MKTIYKNIIAISVILFASNYSNAQEIVVPTITEYYQQELYINPAVTGSQDYISSTLSLKKQWLEIEGSPGVQRLQVHSPFFNNKMGMGLLFQHESYGVTNNFNFGLSYAYHIKFDKGTLSLGLKGSVITFQERYADAEIIGRDPNFLSNGKMLWGFNTGVGAYYATDKFYAGLSLPAMFDNSLKHADYKLMNKLDFEQAPVYLTGAYVFNMREITKIRLKPHVLIGYSKQYKWIYNTGVTAFFYDRCWIGLNIKYRNEAGATLGVRLFDILNLGYAFTTGYDMPYTYKGLSHEINLNVIFGRNKTNNKMQYF